LNDAWSRGRQKIGAILEKSIEDFVRKANHADQVNGVNMSTDYADVKLKYLLLPVWMSSFRYKNKIYNFMVNGQTGKVGGKSPVAAWKVAVTVAVGLIIAAIIVYLLTKYGGSGNDYEYIGY
jgi:hypothetical protein